jgi:predicted dehydrogenase
MADVAKMAVIGLGIWGQNHALTYHEYHRSKLVCVCDVDEDRAREYAQRYGCDFTTDYNQLASADVDAVSVATPDPFHHAPALAMLKAGKHALIEKPMTTNVEEARDLVAAARTSGVKSMVDFQMRWNPSYMVIKDEIEAGNIGKPVMGYIRLSDAIQVATGWLSWAGKSGPHWFLFPHTMDMMRWLIDEEPIEVYAIGRKGVLVEKGVDTYDAVQALVRFEQAFVTFETSWIVPDSSPSVTDCEMALYGTSGRILFDQDFAGLEIATDRYSYPWVPVGRRDRYGKLGSFIYEPIKYFVDCVLDDKQPSATLEDGLVNTIMIASTMRSVEEKRPVAIEIPPLNK